MSEQELERLRRVVARLADGQQEALEVTRNALGIGEEWEDDARPEDTESLEAALVDVRDILEGASEDARGIMSVDSAKEPESGEDSTEQMLAAAGWELVESNVEKKIWRNPQSGYLYPQVVAAAMTREQRDAELPREPEGDE